MNELKEYDFNFFTKKDTIKNESNKKQKIRNNIIFFGGISFFFSLFLGVLLIIGDIYIEQGKQSYTLYQNSKFHFIKNYKNDSVVEGFSLLLQSHRLMSLSSSDEITSLNDLFLILEKIIKDKQISIDKKKQNIILFLTYLNNYNLDKDKICQDHVITCSILDRFSYDEQKEFKNKINEIKNKVSNLI